MGRLIQLILLAAALLSGAAIADSGGGDDEEYISHHQARRLVQEGRIRSLESIMQQHGLTDVRILEVELERDDGVLIYEFEFLDRHGRVREWEIDAATGAFIKEDD